MALGLRHFTDRVRQEGNGGQPTLDAEGGEELMHIEPSVAVALGNRPLESSGSLYITTKKVVWLSDIDSEKGYAVDFLSISLHAVSRDLEAFAFPCIYAQGLYRLRLAGETHLLDYCLTGGSQSQSCLWIDIGADGDESGDSDIENNEDFDLTTVTELRIVPSDPNQLDALFNIFCECAELNPDPSQEQDEENEWFYGDEQMDGDGDSEWISEEVANPIGQSNGDHDLSHTLLELEINDERFEDAEESESESHGNH